MIKTIKRNRKKTVETKETSKNEFKIKIRTSEKLLPNNNLPIYRNNNIEIKTVEEWIKEDPLFIYNALYYVKKIKVSKTEEIKFSLCKNAHDILMKELGRKYPEVYLFHAERKQDLKKKELLSVLGKPKYVRDVNGVKRDMRNLKPLKSVLKNS